MSKAPEAALPHRPSRRPYRGLMLGANIIPAAGALVWAIRMLPDIGDPAVPLVAGRLARGEKYDPAFLRGMIAANLPAAGRQCSSKMLRELRLAWDVLLESAQEGFGPRAVTPLGAPRGLAPARSSTVGAQDDVRQRRGLRLCGTPCDRSKIVQASLMRRLALEHQQAAACGDDVANA